MDGQTDGQTDGRTDDGQSDPYVALCFAGDTKTDFIFIGSATCKQPIALIVVIHEISPRPPPPQPLGQKTLTTKITSYRHISARAFKKDHRLLQSIYHSVVCIAPRGKELSNLSSSTLVQLFNVSKNCSF